MLGWGWSVTQPHQQRSCTLQWLREAPGNHRSLHWFPVRFDLFWLHAEGNYLVSQMLSCGGDICHTWKCLWKRRGVDLYTKNWLTLTLEMLVCRRELIHDLRNLLTEKRPALDPAGFNSPKPLGPVLLDGPVRNSGNEKKHGISYYIYIKWLQIYMCNYCICTCRSINLCTNEQNLLAHVSAN